MDNAAQEVLDLIQALEHYNRNEEFPPDQFERFREMVINAVDWSYDMLGVGNGDEGICQRILGLVNEIENVIIQNIPSDRPILFLLGCIQGFSPS